MAFLYYSANFIIRNGYNMIKKLLLKLNSGDKQLLFLGYVVFGLCAVIIFIPYVTNGFVDDDIINSQIWGLIHRFNLSLASYMLITIKNWMASGRIMLSAIPGVSLFYFIHDAFLLRAFSIATFIINVGLFVVILRKLKVDYAFIGVFLLCLLGLFHIIRWHDPLSGYAGLYPLLGSELCLSLIFLLKWRESAMVKNLWISAWIAFLSLLCYEINLIYYSIAVYFIYTHKDKKLLRNLCVITSPLLLFLCLNFLVRMQASTPYSGSSLGDLDAFPITYIQQIYATLPGIYYISFGKNYCSLTNILTDIINQPIIWLLIVGVTIAMTIFLKSCLSERNKKSLNVDLKWLGWLFILTPAFFVAISARYQTELKWGFGYLPIYYQNFGLAILLSICMVRLIRLNRFAYIILALIIALYISMNWIVNTQVNKFVAMDNFTEPRNILQQQLSDGLLNSIVDGDIIELPNGIPPVINGNLIYQYSKKRIVIPNEAIADDFISSQVLIPRQNAHHYFLQLGKMGDSFIWQLAPSN